MYVCKRERERVMQRERSGWFEHTHNIPNSSQSQFFTTTTTIIQLLQAEILGVCVCV